MAATSDSPHLPALGVHVRAEVGQILEATLLELIDLSLIGKQLHRSICGPPFNSTHARLDEFVERWHEMADTIAERTVTIGYWPDGQADAVASAADHAPVAHASDSAASASSTSVRKPR